MYDYISWPLQELESDTSTMMNQCDMGAWGTRCSTPGLHSRSGGCGVTCQVEGCVADLSIEEKAYCMKKRICSEHMRAECIVRPGDNQQLWRFCFQCGKLEPLSNFDGTKRSCRARLERRRLPPRRSVSWSAGYSTKSTNSGSTTTTPAPQAQQQQMALMRDIQQQQAMLEKLNRQMLLMQQQQQQQQQQQPQMQTCSMLDAGLPTNLVSASPEAMALLQQQQMLLEQKRMQLQMLRSAMAQTGLQVPNLSPTASGPNTPSVLAPGRLSHESSLMHSQLSPSASLAATASGSMLNPCAPVPAASSQQLMSCQGFMMNGEQAHMAQVQPQGTGAAAAAALAGNSTWPFSGAASCMGGSAAGSLNSGDNTPAEVEMTDEFDPLTAEFAAAFPDLDLGPSSDTMTARHSAPAAQQQWQQERQLSASIEAAVAAFRQPAAPMVQNNLDFQTSQMSMMPGGFPQTGSNQQLPVAMQAPVAPQMDAQHMQMQALMQSVHSLQETVRELSVRVARQGGSP